MKTNKTNPLSLVFFSLCLLMAFSSYGKERSAKEDRVKSLVIFSITKYVQWPDDDNEIVIGILSDDQELLRTFNEIASQRSSARKIVIKSFSSLENALKKSDLLFIPHEMSAAVENISEINTQNVLIVTEKEGLAKHGSAINFVTVDGKLRFEMNKKAVERSGLRVSSKLAEMAIEV
ncbi:hypothetical protein C900_03346 [Fulvivirga imtechensis AK7]|uniref:Transmembrane protein n=1 Tax=Fulvivirga imtechensis AK7 TaxID=1237149 RepID=L8JPM3_9BACT|nr:YfiR family protein [Fulvivirga imtechensis]ELR70911.1 hypothetical protein C900_03346 [Fulvivirga imtechensis AK7]